MRYLREWTNPQGKQATAFEDEITDVDVSASFVTLTSFQGQLKVRLQVTRAEFEQVFAAIRNEEEWTRRLILPPPRAETWAARIARFFSVRL